MKTKTKASPAPTPTDSLEDTLRQTQRALLESEARVRIISELTSDYTYAVRVEPDGQLVAEWMAGAFERVTGYNLGNSDFSGGYPSLLHPDDTGAFLKRIERLLANQPDVREYRIVTKSGETRWVRDHARPEWSEAEGRVVRLYGAAQDITERKQAEAAMLSSEQRFRAIIDQAPDGIMLLSAEGRLLFASPATQRIIGYTPEEVLGADPLEHMHPDDQAVVLGLLSRIVSEPGALAQANYRTRHKDGAWRWIDTTVVNLLAEPSVGALVFNYRDITAQRQAEADLQASEHRFRALIEHSADGVVLLNDQGIVTYASPAAARVVGATPEYWQGGDILNRVHPQDMRRTVEMLQQILAAPGTVISASVRYRHYDDSWRWLEVHARNLLHEPAVNALVANFRDVTDRILAEQALKRERDLITEIMDTSPVGITHVSRRGQLIFANARAEQVLGLRKSEPAHRLYNDPAWRITDYDGGDFPEDELPFRRVMASGERVWGVRHAIEWPDGRRVLLSINAAPVFDEHGELDGMVAALADVTELRRAEQANQASERRFRALIEKSSDGVSLLDADGCIIYSSESVLRISGFTPTERLGQSYEETVHPDDLADIQTRMQALIAEPGAASSAVIYRSLHKDGSWRWLEAVGTNLLHDPSVRALVINYRDVTARLQHEREQNAIVEVSRALRAAQTRVEMFPVLLDQVLALLQSDGAAIVLRDAATGESVVALARGQWAAGTGKRLAAAEHADEIQEALRFFAAGLETDIQAVLNVPLMSQERVIGTLWAGRASPMSSGEARLFTAIADIAANAIHRATLHEQTRLRAEQMAAVNSLGRTLAETFSTERIYERLYAAAMQLVPDISDFIVWQTDADSGRMTAQFAMINGKRLAAREQPPVVEQDSGRDPKAEAIRSRQPMIVNDLAAHVPAQAGPRSGLYVPMLSRGSAMGVLAVHSQRPQRFGAADAELWSLVANTAAVMIANARLFDEAQRRMGHMQAVREIESAITSSLDLGLTLNLFVSRVISQLGVDAADILLVNRHNFTLEFQAGRGFRTPNFKRGRAPVDQGLAGRAAIGRRMVSLPVLDAADARKAIAPDLAQEGFQAYLGVPLIAKGIVKGVLELFHRSPLSTEPEWLEFLESLASQAAIAIDNAQLFNELQTSNLQLSMAYDATIEGWSRALDLRDKETEGHTLRVTELTLDLARAMGLREDDLVHIRRGALLHDIGKLGVPDNILHKPAELTEAEWTTMRLHPVHAYELLSAIAFLEPALDIPYCHHEKWDGSGYPRGLKGDEIPLAARIFAVADVWDALCSDRPYRAGWPKTRVRDHIKSLAGSHFDPQVVDQFLGILARA